MLRDGTIEVKDPHEKKPELTKAHEMMTEFASKFHMASTFAKPDYFVPVPVIEGMASAETLTKKGIMIHCLDSRMVYPKYGVWTATTQEYLNLLSNFVQQNKSRYAKYDTMVDLGCGTGVLPIVLAENGGYQGKVFSFDNQPNAIEATKMNSQIFGLGQRVTAREADIVDLYYMDAEESRTDSASVEKVKEMNFYRELSKDLEFPFQVDLVVCNPPWIPAEFVRETNPLDNGVYDPQEKFLKSMFNFCRVHLDKNGEMLLVYSDLAY